MLRPTTIFGLGGLLIFGIILADFVTHPTGTQDAGNAIVDIEKPGFDALLGTAP
jgi:hypothetical protein